jgi:MFS family permease
MSSSTPAGIKALLNHPPFAFYFWARGCSALSYQIAAVAVGWQIYSLTNSAFALGMIGLMQFLPTLLLIFIAGHAADRYRRTSVIQICRVIEGATAIFLAWGSFAGWLNETQIFVAVLLFGIAVAFETPATAALLPAVVPEGMLQKGIALSTGTFHLATIAGPALGGLMYALSPGVPYTVMAILWLIAGIMNAAIALDRPVTAKEPPTISALFAGVGFVRRNPAILGTISLDLFAVLLGGATALLPIYARDILNTGPWGLGVLRGAPALGALLMTVVLTRYVMRSRTGIRMFQAVIVFGLSTIVFALSHTFWLSLLALAIMGAADMVSVVIRSSLVQLATPDEMRGRVSAVNFLFINASNQLGEFESGITAAFLGTVPAAVLGGVGTIAVALLWMKLFPTLRNMERLE